MSFEVVAFLMKRAGHFLVHTYAGWCSPNKLAS
jgi:hypothetical protein